MSLSDAQPAHSPDPSSSPDPSKSPRLRAMDWVASVAAGLTVLALNITMSETGTHSLLHNLAAGLAGACVGMLVAHRPWRKPGR
ncbi:hypothetical protein ACLBXM_02550 [Xanthobacteraceae bacterium A53D]